MAVTIGIYYTFVKYFCLIDQTNFFATSASQMLCVAQEYLSSTEHVDRSTGEEAEEKSLRGGAMSNFAGFY